MAVRRFTKQLIAAAVFFVLLGAVAALIFLAGRPEPSCFDGIRNQDEEGADCGGICALACRKVPRFSELFLGEARMLATAENLYDMLAAVENKNLDFGSPSFAYEFALLDSASSVVAARRGSSYILPGEKKVIIEQRLGGDRAASHVRFTVSDIAWEEMLGAPYPELGIRDRAYDASLRRASGVVVNRTGLDFRQIDITILLKDSAGIIAGAAKTDVQTLRDSDQRYFEVRWPPEFRGNVARVEMEARTNVFLNENFLERYGIKNRQRFQEEVPSPPPQDQRRFR